MAIEILAVEPNSTTSEALVDDSNPRAPEKDSPILARCGECRTKFKATRSLGGIEAGRFCLATIGHATLKCPACGHESTESLA